MTQRKIEAAILAYLRSRKIIIGSDGLGGNHFLVTRSASFPGIETSGLNTRCAFQIQIGEQCGFEHERVDVADLAKAIMEGP